MASEKMSNNDEEFEILKDDYGYSITVPIAWSGVFVTREDQDAKSPLHEMLTKLDEDYFIVRHRHPKWTAETPYQDIVFSIVRREEWNKHANDATSGVLELLPQTILSNFEYLLVHDPYHYSSKNQGYDEVMDILKHNMKTY
ncbi:MAG: hypothetical protein JEZ08_04515 [Clostridiales bacterium]|nr:hypothetical protein [Clostridiales bacterium]